MALLFDRPVLSGTAAAGVLPTRSPSPGLVSPFGASPKGEARGVVSPFGADCASRPADPGQLSPFNTTSRVRLTLAPATPSGPIDGAWWPCSTDLAAEIQPLLDAINNAFPGRVARLTYDRQIWGPVPRRLPYRGSYIKNGWFEMTDPHQVALTLRNGTRLVLLVIPPDLAADQAMWAMHRAIEPGNTLSPLQILRQAPSVAYEVALQRWRGNAGQVGRS